MNANPLTPAGDMDDMGDHAMQMHTSEGGFRLDTRRPFIPQGCDQQGRQEATVQPQPAEACTELGADDDRRSVAGAIAWPVRMVLAFALVAACWHFSGFLP